MKVHIIRWLTLNDHISVTSLNTKDGIFFKRVFLASHQYSQAYDIHRWSSMHSGWGVKSQIGLHDTLCYSFVLFFNPSCFFVFYLFLLFHDPYLSRFWTFKDVILFLPWRRTEAPKVRAPYEDKRSFWSRYSIQRETPPFPAPTSQIVGFSSQQYHPTGHRNRTEPLWYLPSASHTDLETLNWTLGIPISLWVKIDCVKFGHYESCLTSRTHTRLNWHSSMNQI